LKQDKVYPGCIAKSLKTMSKVYDSVEAKVGQLIQKLSGHQQDLAYIENGKTVPLKSAPIKDHLHVYSSQVLLNYIFIDNFFLLKRVLFI
jgi:hypothetical protein